MWVQIAASEEAIFRGKHIPAHTRRRPAVSYAKMTELITMLFGLWTRVSPTNHVLDEGPDHPMTRGKFLGERTCPGMPDDTLP